MVWMDPRLRQGGDLVLCLLRGRDGLLQLVFHSFSIHPSGMVIWSRVVRTGFKHLVQTTYKVRPDEAVEVCPSIHTRDLRKHAFDATIDRPNC
jgi:hypothetical protein